MLVVLDAGTLGDLELSGLPENAQVYQQTQASDLIERCREKEIIVTNKVIIDAEAMKALPRLKAIIVTATGVNNIDTDYAHMNGIKVMNAKGYSTDSVVTHTFAMVFKLVHDLDDYLQFTQSGKWIDHSSFTYFNRFHELSALRWGIIGLGNIGQKVATIAQSFGSTVQYYSTSGNNNQQAFKQVELDELLSTSDIISIHAPLNKDTKNLLSQNELEKLKANCRVINVGRGGIINEMALRDFLKNNEKNIKFALDVIETEPMNASSELVEVLNNKNLILTPHVAWASVEARKTLWEITLKNIQEAIEC